MDHLQHDAPNTDSFPVAAAAVMTRLTRSLARVLEGADVVHGMRPIDISRGLGIDMKLAWKASHLANSAQPFDAVRHLPGLAGMRILLDAAVAGGAPRPLAAESLAAFTAVQEVISERCGSRRSFESMISGLDGPGDSRLEEEHRKLLYEGASSVWGMRAETLHRMDVLFHSKSEGLLDCLTIRTMAGFRRLRGDVPVLFPRPKVLDDRGVESRTGKREPIDSSVGPDELPVVRSLARGPVPVIRKKRSSTDVVFEATRSDVADPEPFSIATGEFLRKVQSTRVSGDSHGIYQMMRLRIPAVRAVFDILIHGDVLGPDIAPDTYLGSELHASAALLRDLRQVRLPITVKTEELGVTDEKYVQGLSGMSERIALAASVCELSEFRWFRMELVYPPVCSLIAFECELPAD
ncbi:MAG: hypothetical protein VX672_04330 [Planctomycetota bacterium]|nr:hypothetical protein [Planctomycetota bacterium]